jgi:hypothetical protein
MALPVRWQRLVWCAPALLVLVAFGWTLRVPIFSYGVIPVDPAVRQAIARDYPDASKYKTLSDDVVFPYAIKTHGLWEMMRRPLIPGYAYWRPVGLAAFWLDQQVWGMWPPGYHLDNLLLHILNCYLLAFLVFRITGSRKWALGAACLFGAFPNNAIFPAISIKFDVLCATFVLGSALLFLTYLEQDESSAWRRGWAVAGAFALFVLALGSKETAVAFPLFLLGLTFLRLKARPAGLKVLVLPIFVAAAWGVMALGAQITGGAAADRLAPYLDWARWPRLAGRSFNTLFPSVRTSQFALAQWQVANIWLMPQLLARTVPVAFIVLGWALVVKRAARPAAVLLWWTMVMYLPAAPIAYGYVGQQQYGYIPYLGETAIVAIAATLVGEWIAFRSGRQLWAYLSLPVLIGVYFVSIFVGYPWP